MTASESRSLVLINGLPGSGKTTLGRALARSLGRPLLSKDALKDFLAEMWPVEPDPRWLSDAANTALWRLLSDVPGGAIVETWFGPTGIDAMRGGLRTAGYNETAVVELWCDVDPAEARRRFMERATDSNDRHRRHNSEATAGAFWDKAQSVGPLRLGQLIVVPTAAPTPDAEVARLAIAIEAMLSADNRRL